MTVFWFVLAVLYVTALFVLGLATLRKGHVFLFIVGFVFPFLWIIGAMIEPTPRAAGGTA
jgi:hypothetical protein